MDAIIDNLKELVTEQQKQLQLQKEELLKNIETSFGQLETTMHKNMVDYIYSKSNHEVHIGDMFKNKKGEKYVVTALSYDKNLGYPFIEKQSNKLCFMFVVANLGVSEETRTILSTWEILERRNQKL